MMIPPFPQALFVLGSLVSSSSPPELLSISSSVFGFQASPWVPTSLSCCKLKLPLFFLLLHESLASAFPAGKLLEAILPDTEFSAFSYTWTLNPGRFNMKEHSYYYHGKRWIHCPLHRFRYLGTVPPPLLQPGVSRQLWLPNLYCPLNQLHRLWARRSYPSFPRIPLTRRLAL